MLLPLGIHVQNVSVQGWGHFEAVGTPWAVCSWGTRGKCPVWCEFICVSLLWWTYILSSSPSLSLSFSLFLCLPPAFNLRVSSSTPPSLFSLHASSYHLPHCPIMTASLSPSHLSPPSSFLPVFSTLLLPFMQAQVAEMCILTWMKSFVKPVLIREQQRQRRLTQVSSWFIST